MKIKYNFITEGVMKDIGKSAGLGSIIGSTLAGSSGLLASLNTYLVTRFLSMPKDIANEATYLINEFQRAIFILECKIREQVVYDLGNKKNPEDNKVIKKYQSKIKKLENDINRIKSCKSTEELKKTIAKIKSIMILKAVPILTGLGAGTGAVAGGSMEAYQISKKKIKELLKNKFNK